MKKKLFLSGILGVALVFAITVISCDNDDGGSSANPLEGTWNYSVNGQIQQSITFTGSNYVQKNITANGLVPDEEGTYSTGGGTITFRPTKKINATGNLAPVSGANATPTASSYSITGNSLLLGGTTYLKS